MYGYKCEYCEGIVKERLVKQEVFKHTSKSAEVGQPSPVDIIMTSGDACPTYRGDLVAASLRYEMVNGKQFSFYPL